MDSSEMSEQATVKSEDSSQETLASEALISQVPNPHTINADPLQHSVFVRWGPQFEARASGWGIVGLMAVLGVIVIWWMGH